MKKKLFVCDCCKEKVYTRYRFEDFEACGSCYGDLTVINTRLNFFMINGKFSSVAQNPSDFFSELSSNYLNFDYLYSESDGGDWQNDENHN